MPIYQLGDKRPQIHPDAWIAESAVIIGDVHVAAGANIWWNSVLRGDIDTIVIGEDSNIQDGSVLHTDPGMVLEVGPRVTVGHRVILHGCIVGEESLIGMGSVILNHAVIGKHCLVGANTLIPENKHFPDGVLILGSPGKVVRELDPALIANLPEGARRYRERSRLYATQLKQIG